MLCARLAPTNISMTKTSNSSTGGSSKGDKKRKRGTRDALAPSPEPHSLIRKNGVQRRGKKKAATAGDAAQEQLVASAVRSTSVSPESKKCKRRKKSKKVKESHDSEDGAGPSSNATSSKEVDKPETQGQDFGTGDTQPLMKNAGTDAASAHAPGPVTRLGHLVRHMPDRMEALSPAKKASYMAQLNKLRKLMLRRLRGMSGRGWSRFWGCAPWIAEAIGPLDEVVEEEEKNRSILAKKMDIASLEKLMAAKMRCESLGL
ncbi:hypothetical protein E4U26_000076 [Claviceps purpurea]|nr:hypothetical protein E4U26_000076 [Claviceps purpurea]